MAIKRYKRRPVVVIPSGIKTTNGRTVVLDDLDIELAVANGPWHAKQPKPGGPWYARHVIYTGIVAGKFKMKDLFLHRLLLPEAKIVDHINGNGLDNRRANLRAVTRVENGRNSHLQSNNKSGARGVFWGTRACKWIARIGHNGKGVHIGYFDDFDAARAAWLKKATELWSDEDLTRMRSGLEYADLLHEGPQ